VLRQQFEPLHEASTEIALSSLLPAILVAWADGAVQAAERRLIVDLAERVGVANDRASMARVRAWLEAPPDPSEVRQFVGKLATVTRDVEAPEQVIGDVVAWARAVARADGGFLGIGSISPEEKQTLDWLEAVIDPTHPSDVDPPPRAQPVYRPHYLASLGVIRALLAQRRQAEAPRPLVIPDGLDATWPQACPRFPGRMPPAVLGIRQSEYQEYMNQIVARYVHTVKTRTWRALQVATADAPAPLDDREFGRLVLETPFSRLLVPTLDPPDQTRFAQVLSGGAHRGTLYKVDHSQLANQQPLPGVHLSPSVGLFSLRDDRLFPIAIAVGTRVFEPGEGESWSRARHFLLQGCSLSLVGGVHSELHFPTDSVIAITREVLPDAHPVMRLVDTHGYLQLPLNYGVRWNPRSVANNDQREIYTPYPSADDGFFRGLADRFAGMPGNSAYPGYRYPMTAPDLPGLIRSYYWKSYY